MTSLNALSHPYPLKMPWLFGLYAGVWTDFKTALVIGSAFLMLFLILFLLAWCLDQVRLKILNWTTTVSNPCNLVSFCQFLIQIGLEFGFAFVLLTGYGIDSAYSWPYGLSIVANFELIRLFFVALRWLIQKRKENSLSKVVLIGSAGGMGVSSATSLLLVEQLLMAIMARQNIQETVFIVLWLILPLSVLWMIVAAVILQIHIPCKDKSLLEQRDFWKTFMAASLVMAMASVLVLPPSISLVSIGGLGIAGWLAWKKLERHPASRCG